MQGDVRKISVRARLNIFKFDSRCIMKPSLCVCVTKVVVTSSVSISAEEGTGVMRITGFISFHNSFDQFCNFFFFFFLKQTVENLPVTRCKLETDRT